MVCPGRRPDRIRRADPARHHRRAAGPGGHRPVRHGGFAANGAWMPVQMQAPPRALAEIRPQGSGNGLCGRAPSPTPGWRPGREPFDVPVSDAARAAAVNEQGRPAALAQPHLPGHTSPAAPPRLHLPDPTSPSALARSHLARLHFPGHATPARRDRPIFRGTPSPPSATPGLPARAGRGRTAANRRPAPPARGIRLSCAAIRRKEAGARRKRRTGDELLRDER